MNNFRFADGQGMAAVRESRFGHSAEGRDGRHKCSVVQYT